MVLTAASMKMIAFRAMLEAARTSEASVYLNETTQRCTHKAIIFSTNDKAPRHAVFFALLLFPVSYVQLLSAATL
jgi:hypothetical protein